MHTFYTYKLPQKAGVVTPDPESTEALAEWLSANYPNFNSTSFHNSYDRQTAAVSQYVFYPEYITENGKLVSIRFETLLNDNEEYFIDPEWKEYHLFFMNHSTWDTPGSFTKDPA